MGANFSATVGKASVIDAANIQWVKQPSDWPCARVSLGNISEIKTHITAPCPTACAAMNAKIQAGTMAKFSEKNAYEHKPSDTIYPKEPIYNSVRRPSLSINQRPTKVKIRLQ